MCPVVFKWASHIPPIKHASLESGNLADSEIAKCAQPLRGLEVPALFLKAPLHQEAAELESTQAHVLREISYIFVHVRACECEVAGIAFRLEFPSA